VYEILENKILYAKGAIPKCKEIIEYIEKTEDDVISPWIEWANMYQTVDKDKRVYGVSKSFYGLDINEYLTEKKSKDIIKIISNNIIKYSNLYAEEFKIPKDQFPVERTLNSVIQKYDEPEIDAFAALLDMHTDHPDPENTDEYTVLIYWNDDYDGGEIAFPKLGLCIKPEAGSVLVFRSADLDLVHTTTPLTKGNKYITLFLWTAGFIKGFNPKPALT
jgi:hypothetical protein